MPDIKYYIKLIKSGEVVAFPTETVYGLGADALNPAAIKKVFSLKSRPADNPLIVHISSSDQIHNFAAEIPASALELMAAFWPGPLTLVFKKKPLVLDLITAGLETVALRMPDHAVALKLITETGALVAPSANKSGRPSPTKAEHVLADFGDDFPVIDGGATEIGIESTVLDLTSNVPSILRPGKIGKAEIESVLGKEINITDEENINTPKSPGQKYSHYKPKAGVQYGSISIIENNILYLVQDEKFSGSKNMIHYSGNLELLSKELYDRFRQADIEGYASVFIEQIEAYQKKNPSLYTALMNRIQKAVGS
ncbi:MAG: L-threonylcarbamoyladenylate synthase [Balneolaceae bacterium]